MDLRNFEKQAICRRVSVCRVVRMCFTFPILCVLRWLPCRGKDSSQVHVRSPVRSHCPCTPCGVREGTAHNCCMNRNCMAPVQSLPLYPAHMHGTTRVRSETFTCCSQVRSRKKFRSPVFPDS
ncbi:hypothetical protein HBI25_067670 [Parastagonospora nodorum]|nr:hypothetical protein HBH46_119140 [Parastagonospora nodorum]KAH4211327.1 hypothetical protein HBI95_054820 [Parastagonospora nodorum]KAH4812554.1 hypothetical protein HBH61_082980 [Parastagonospora nodorum]KAH4983965.1 hypothetical protein HBI76_149780 [Parastagonospora nodorum]KAH5293080.1 hypothetical protein HBI12_231750 [Parastagonospora nodorum]